MIDDCLKLTTYLGERDRARGAFLADALVDVYARHALRTSLVLRGAEGFGVRHLSHRPPADAVGGPAARRRGGRTSRAHRRGAGRRARARARAGW